MALSRASRKELVYVVEHQGKHVKVPIPEEKKLIKYYNGGLGYIYYLKQQADGLVFYVGETIRANYNDRINEHYETYGSRIAEYGILSVKHIRKGTKNKKLSLQQSETRMINLFKPSTLTNTKQVQSDGLMKCSVCSFSTKSGTKWDKHIHSKTHRKRAACVSC